MSELNNEREIKQEIERYVNGQLTPREVDDLWEIFLRDGEYLEYMKSVANLKGISHKHRREEKVKSSYNYRSYAAAAVIALLLAVWGVMNITVQPDQVIAPIDNVELQYYRSADGSLIPGENQIVRDAITFANDGNITKAVTLLEQKLQETEGIEEKARIDITLGSLMYNHKQYAKAIDHFGRVIEKEKQQPGLDVLMLEKAHWYRGNAYLQIERITKAERDIKRAYDYNGAYRRVAGHYLEAFRK